MSLPPSIRCSLAAVSACAALLVPAAAAHAEADQPFSSPTLSGYLEVAQQHWAAPAPHCTGADGEATPLETLLYDDPDPGVVAGAQERGCRIWLDRDWWPRPAGERDCITIVHEWGHLLGHRHSTDTKDVMHAYPTTGAPGCLKFRADRHGLDTWSAADPAPRARPARRCTAASRSRDGAAGRRSCRARADRRARAARREEARYLISSGVPTRR